MGRLWLVACRVQWMRVGLGAAYLQELSCWLAIGTKQTGGVTRGFVPLWRSYSGFPCHMAVHLPLSPLSIVASSVSEFY